ncbi:MAG: hypothetical protein LIP12_17570 [Clostridiales bacterium]|nr:hypothetical protein [Clostridiales bacterium]
MALQVHNLRTSDERAARRPGSTEVMKEAVSRATNVIFNRYWHTGAKTVQGHNDTSSRLPRDWGEPGSV